jgi:putative polyketide hydroxylase
MLSTLDLYIGGFVLMAGPDGGDWSNAARTASSDVGVDVLSYTVACAGADAAGPDVLIDRSDDETSPFWTAYGISRSGASLVRPDGYVAWRAESYASDAADRLTSVLRQVLSIG